jgi:hypothetical protein
VTLGLLWVITKITAPYLSTMIVVLAESIVLNRLTLFAIRLVLVVFANPTSFAFVAGVMTPLVNALSSVATIVATGFVVDAKAGSSTFLAAPLVTSMRAIAWDHFTKHASFCCLHFIVSSCYICLSLLEGF